MQMEMLQILLYVVVLVLEELLQDKQLFHRLQQIHQLEKIVVDFGMVQELQLMILTLVLLQ
jgi:hypothetical protein